MIEAKLWRDAINRAYYAEFYSVLAMLALKGMGVSKHSGAISLFDREFVKKGSFPKGYSKMIHRAFDMRQEADYEEFCNSLAGPVIAFDESLAETVRLVRGERFPGW